MGFNTNTTTRLPAITPIGTKFIFDLTALPAPASNVITLLPGNYIISDTIDFNLLRLLVASLILDPQSFKIPATPNRIAKIHPLNNSRGY